MVRKTQTVCPVKKWICNAGKESIDFNLRQKPRLSFFRFVGNGFIRSAVGTIAEEHLRNNPALHPQIFIDAYVMIPNHLRYHRLGSNGCFPRKEKDIWTCRPEKDSGLPILTIPAGTIISHNLHQKPRLHLLQLRRERACPFRMDADRPGQNRRTVFAGDPKAFCIGACGSICHYAKPCSCNSCPER